MEEDEEIKEEIIPENNRSEIPNPIKPKVPDPEDSNTLADKFIGIAMGLFIELIAFLLALNISNFEIVIVLALLAMLIAIVYFHGQGKKGIVIGLVISIFIPLAVFGGCLLVFMSSF